MENSELINAIRNTVDDVVEIMPTLRTGTIITNPDDNSINFLVAGSLTITGLAIPPGIAIEEFKDGDQGLVWMFDNTPTFMGWSPYRVNDVI